MPINIYQGLSKYFGPRRQILFAGPRVFSIHSEYLDKKNELIMEKKTSAGAKSRYKRFLTLRVRLLAGFLIFASVAFLLIAAFFRMSIVTDLNRSRAASLTKRVGLIGSLKNAVSLSELPPRDYVVTGNSNEIQLWAQRVLVWQKLWNEVHTKEGGAVDQVERRLDTVGRDLDRLQDKQGQLFTVQSAADKADVLSSLSRIERRINDNLDRVSAIESDKAAGFLSDATQNQARTKQLSIFSILLVGSMVIALNVLVHLGLVQPLKALESSIGNGKIDSHAGANRTDEIGSIARKLNAMTADLKKSNLDLRKRYAQLMNLYKISKAVSNEHDIDTLLHLVLRQSLDLIGAETGSIMLIKPNGVELGIRAAEGLDQETISNARVKLGEGISGYVAASGKPLMIQDGVRKAKVAGGKDVKDALSVPLIANDQVIGVFNANNKTVGKFDRNDLRFFTTLAGQIASAISNAALVENIREAYFNTIKVLAAAIDAKDKYTHGHSERVAKYTVTIARRLGLSQADLTRIEAAAYLHDIGKIGVPDSVLNKEGPLTDDEHAMIKKHPTKAAEILGLINFPWGDVIPGVRGHHERYDGFGYPDSLAGEAISRDARIIAVADSYDAMTSDRPYRKGLDRNTAITELVNGREKQFDGEVVDAFIPALLTEWMSSVPGGMDDRLEFLDDPLKEKTEEPKKTASNSGNSNLHVIK